MRPVRLIGLDFGTTTSSCVIASAHLAQNAVSGRQELSGLREDYRSDLVFTPFLERGLDHDRLTRLVDEWLAAGQVRAEDIFGGGALLTGLAAREENAAVLIDVVRSRLGDALVASADDPCLEAWLAFQASAAELSRLHRERWVVNLDMGGGTTNIAVGKNGEVAATGSLFVGARHIELVPGTYRVAKISDFARRLFEHLAISRGPGDTLEPPQVEAILDFYLRLLDAALAGETDVFDHPVARLHQQVALKLPAGYADPIVTLSGGVGELVYAGRAGRPLPPRTFFGDLGIDLATRLLSVPRWADRLSAFQPARLGRATVYGLLLHTTQVSGSTLFLSDPALLPLKNLPILGRLSPNSTAEAIRDILKLVGRSPLGGCVELAGMGPDAKSVAELGERIAAALCEIDFPADRPLVLLAEGNCGKALGQYVSRWGAMPLKLAVLDEIDLRDARFVHLGSLRHQVVPVSFFGMN